MRRVLVVAALTLAATAGASCKKRLAPGTCLESFDCQPGFTCLEGKCVEREKFPGDRAAAPVPAPQAPGRPGMPNLPSLPHEPVVAPTRTPRPTMMPVATPGPGGKWPKPNQRLLNDKRYFPPDT